MPSTNSITRYGMPASVTPPSIRRAMCGWFSAASTWRSRRNRRCSSSEYSPRRSSLTATFCSKSVPTRSPRNTAAMPPRPSARTMRNAPNCWPTRWSGRKSSDRMRAECSTAETSRKPSPVSAASSRRKPLRSAGSATCASSQVARSPGGNSINASNAARKRTGASAGRASKFSGPAWVDIREKGVSALRCQSTT